MKGQVSQLGEFYVLVIIGPCMHKFPLIWFLFATFFFVWLIESSLNDDVRNQEPVRIWQKSRENVRKMWQRTWKALKIVNELTKVNGF